MKLSKQPKRPYIVNTFQPSFAAKALSFLTAPKQLCAWLGLGATAFGIGGIPLSLAAAGTLVVMQYLLTQILIGDYVVRSATFMEADHLARYPIQGGLLFVTVPPVLKALALVGTEKADFAKHALDNLLTYEQYFNYLGLSNSFLVQDLILQIKTLNINQITAFPLGYMRLPMGGHVMLGSVEREEKETYIVRIHNGGEGVESYHECKEEKENFRKTFHTTLEIRNVSFSDLEELLKKTASLLSFKLKNNIELFYKQFTDLLDKGAIRVPANENSQGWMRPQIGNSCSGYSIKCFLKYYLSDEEFAKFEEIFLHQSVNTLKQGLQGSTWFFNKNKERYLAYQELSSKLNHYQSLPAEEIKSEPYSLLSKLSSNLQNSFWRSVFPMSYTTASASKLGIESDSYHIIGGLQPYLKLHAAFKKMNGLEWVEFIKKQGRTKEFLVEVDELEKAQQKFKIIMQEFYLQLDWLVFSSQDRKNLKSFKEKLMGKVEKFYLNQIYKIIFDKQTRSIKDSLALQLQIVFENLQKEDYQQARRYLNLCYDSVPIDDLNEEQKEDQLFVLCKSLYIPDAIRLEDIDIRAGLANFFKKLGYEIPAYLGKHLALYQQWRLEESFPHSPWRDQIIVSKAVVTNQCENRVKFS